MQDARFQLSSCTVIPAWAQSSSESVFVDAFVKPITWVISWEAWAVLVCDFSSQCLWYENVKAGIAWGEPRSPRGWHLQFLSVLVLWLETWGSSPPIQPHLAVIGLNGKAGGRGGGRGRRQGERGGDSLWEWCFLSSDGGQNYMDPLRAVCTVWTLGFQLTQVRAHRRGTVRVTAAPVLLPDACIANVFCLHVGHALQRCSVGR